MGQIVKRKKKGRPSKADLARRAEEEAAAAAAEEPDVRRSLRRRNVRYNIDFDDYLEEDDEDEEEDERRRERKLKLVVKLNQGSEPLTPTPGGSETLEGPVSEDECERKPLKKRRIGSGRDEDDDEQEEDNEDDHVGVAGDDEEVCIVSFYGSDQSGRKIMDKACVKKGAGKGREYSSAEISDGERDFYVIGPDFNMPFFLSHSHSVGEVRVSNGWVNCQKLTQTHKNLITLPHLSLTLSLRTSLSLFLYISLSPSLSLNCALSPLSVTVRVSVSISHS